MLFTTNCKTQSDQSEIPINPQISIQENQYTNHYQSPPKIHYKFPVHVYHAQLLDSTYDV